MSQDDELLAMGRAASEYGEIKKRLAALYGEVERLGREVERIAWYLVPRGDSYSQSTLRNGSPAPDLSRYPAAEELRKVFEETLAAQNRKKQLYARLKEFGFEPKD